MSQQKTRDLTQGPVGRALFRVSAPMSIGILGVLSVGLADAAFLARAGDVQLTAIGFIYPAIIALTSLSIGMGAGTSAVVSQALGREGGSDATAARLALHSLIFAAALAICAALAFYLSAPLLFELMGAKGAVKEAVLSYLPWWCASFVPMVAGMGLNAVFRAGGESGIAATVMTLQSLVNIALDPIFIFGVGVVPALGTEGAGIATCIARVVGFAGLLTFAIRSGRLSLSRNCLAGIGDSLRRIARIGGPAAASNAINPLGLSLVTSAAATLGDAAVAGFGAATRLQSLLFVPMLALSAGIGPVVGQAWGAEKFARAQRAVRLTFLTCLGYGAVLSGALMFAAPWLDRWRRGSGGCNDLPALGQSRVLRLRHPRHGQCRDERPRPRALVDGALGQPNRTGLCAVGLGGGRTFRLCRDHRRICAGQSLGGPGRACALPRRRSAGPVPAPGQPRRQNLRPRLTARPALATSRASSHRDKTWHAGARDATFPAG